VGDSFTNPTVEDGSDATSIPLDGAEGRNTEPFVAEPDANGTQFPFGIAYSGLSDLPDGVVTKTYGLNAEDLPSSHKNTYLYELMYRTLFGQNSLPNLLEGTPEDETLQGGAEKDLIRANESNDTLIGSVNSDILYGEEGNDLLQGDRDGSQSHTAADGDDLLYGGLGRDRLYGQGGNDLLVGGADGDLLVGGAGRDTFAIAEALDNESISTAEPTTITDFQIGQDFLALGSDRKADNLTFTQRGNDTIVNSVTGSQLATLLGVSASALAAAAESTFIPLPEFG
jgi:glycerophosphoryl diester phosphodiesterase